MQLSNSSTQLTDRLDLLLEGETAEVKARVLNTIRKYQIDADDEFFVIFLALGRLQDLIETSPQEWQGILNGFKHELNRWTDTNLELLAKLADKSEITERLATNSEGLAKILTKLIDAINELLVQLSTSNGLILRQIEALQTSETELKNLLMSLLDTQSDQLNKILDLSEETNNLKYQFHSPSQTWTWKDKFFASGLAALLVILGGFHLHSLKTVEQMNQQLGWLLYKANRTECRLGVKAADSPECQGL